jgi:hypothetical protein
MNSASIRISTSSPTPKLELSEIPNSERLSERCAEKPMRAPNGPNWRLSDRQQALIWRDLGRVAREAPAI